MPLDDIKKGIELSASDESKRIIASADQEHDKILSDAQISADRVKAAAESETEKETNKIKIEYEALEWRQISSAELKERERVIEAEAKRIKPRIASEIRKSRLYGTIFRSAIKHASSITDIKNTKIIVRKEDRKFVDATKAEIETKNIGGGLIICTNDESIKIDATIDHIIERNEQMIRSAISKHIFKSINNVISEKPKINSIKPKKSKTKKRQKIKRAK